jgi:hypothetical protein
VGCNGRKTDKTLWFVILSKFCKRDLIKKDEMGAACGIHARGKKHTQGLCSNHEGKKFLEDFDVDMRKILKRNRREQYEVYCIHRVQRKKSVNIRFKSSTQLQASRNT